MQLHCWPTSMQPGSKTQYELPIWFEPGCLMPEYSEPNRKQLRKATKRGTRHSICKVPASISNVRDAHRECTRHRKQQQGHGKLLWRVHDPVLRLAASVSCLPPALRRERGSAHNSSRKRNPAIRR